MNTISEYDERQLKLMKEALMFFEKKQLCFMGLARDLEAAYRALESIDKGWTRGFWEAFDPLYMISEMEHIRNSEDDGMLEVESEIDKREKERAIQKAFVSLKKLVKGKLREAASSRAQKLSAWSLKNLSFPGFKVEEMEFSAKEHTLEISLEGAWLKEKGGQVLGKGLLFFNNWESLKITRFLITTDTWVLLDHGHPEYLKDIQDFTFSKGTVHLRGLGEKTGQLLKWEIINADVHAEFESELSS